MESFIQIEFTQVIVIAIADGSKAASEIIPSHQHSIEVELHTCLTGYSRDMAPLLQHGNSIDQDCMSLLIFIIDIECQVVGKMPMNNHILFLSTEVEEWCQVCQALKS